MQKNPYRRANPRQRAQRRSGAAMLIVMLVLLVVTAGATMAVYSSQFESRAAGHQRQAMQTAQVAQGGLAAASTEIEMMGGGGSLEYYMCSSSINRNARLSPGEPPMNAGVAGSPEGLTSRSRRYASTALVLGSGAERSATVAYMPIDGAGVGMTAYEPRYIVDVNDAYAVAATFVGTGAGSRVDGGGATRMQYLVSTMTSHGRMTRTGLVDGDGGTSDAAVMTAPERAATQANLRRDIFETSITARAWSISGPYAPRGCRSTAP